MAEDTLFNINAGQILSKLHLAARSQAPNFIIVNTAIKDETESSTPENPGKCEFDFSNKSGEYEVCFITVDFEYNEQIDLEHDPVIQKANEAIKKQKDNRNVTDDGKTVSKEVQERNKLISSRFKDLKTIKPDSSNDEIKSAVEEANKKRAEEKDKKIQTHLKTLVLPQMTQYFETMCGKTVYKKPSIDNLQPLQLNTKFKTLKDKQLVSKDFKIITIEDKDLKTWKENYLKNQDKPVTVNLGFKVQFNVNVDAM